MRGEMEQEIRYLYVRLMCLLFVFISLFFFQFVFYFSVTSSSSSASFVMFVLYHFPYILGVFKLFSLLIVVFVISFLSSNDRLVYFVLLLFVWPRWPASCNLLWHLEWRSSAVCFFLFLIWFLWDVRHRGLPEIGRIGGTISFSPGSWIIQSAHAQKACNTETCIWPALLLIIIITRWHLSSFAFSLWMFQDHHSCRIFRNFAMGLFMPTERFAFTFSLFLSLSHTHIVSLLYLSIDLCRSGCLLRSLFLPFISVKLSVLE